MKRILITGAGSYIGTNVENHLNKYNVAQGRVHYVVDTLSQLDETWKNVSFASYDAIFHVTGIAHADTAKVSEETKALYYRVNCDLAVETAKKAVAEGVKQFIYMSSIIVYGESAPVGKIRRITAATEPAPANFYGDSKLQAELGLAKVSGIKIAVLRPPMIYGKGSKGNYPLLSKLARKLPFFPTIQNERSMLYVENLCEFVRILLEQEREGLFFPQNREYTSTADMVRQIGEAHGKKIPGLGLLNPFVILLSKVPGKIGRIVNKAFGSLSIEQAMSDIGEEYRIYSLEESVHKTEE